MRLLVTGGCGFVGSNFLRYVLQHYGPEMVTNLDSLASGSLASVEGLAQTGAVVTSAALIMVVALSGLVFGHVAGLQELGVGLSFGVLFDATIVRGLVLPSAMTLLGRWNWWLPRPVAALLRTTASPLETREARQ